MLCNKLHNKIRKHSMSRVFCGPFQSKQMHIVSISISLRKICILKVMATEKQWVRPRIHISAPTIEHKSFSDETVNRYKRIIRTPALEYEMHGHYELWARISNAISGVLRIIRNKLYSISLKSLFACDETVDLQLGVKWIHWCNEWARLSECQTNDRQRLLHRRNKK